MAIKYNMEFYTHITIPKTPFTFSYTVQTVLLGSCFAENIGKKLEGNKFKTDLNPFGTLYNPSSIAEAIRMLLQPEQFTGDDLFQHEGIYHSFSHHSRFSSPSETECLANINRRLFSSADTILKAQRMILTFGTAWVYSPIRHWKDGAHGNQLSKATLLLAIDALQKEFPEHTAYFPAYEIMMDELREYRFYADDMLHPSTTAIEYIWERFTGSMLSPDSLSILKEWKDIQKAINHKPFQPESEAYKRFISQTLLKMERLNEKFPYFDMTNEVEMIKKKF